MTSKCQIVHDFNFLYILVEVSDSTPNNDATIILNSWDRDCIDPYFSFKSTNLENPEYTEGDHQIRFQRNAIDSLYIDGYSGNFDGSTNEVDPEVLELFEYAIVTNQYGYLLEASFPIIELAGESDFNYYSFRFDIGTTDNTNGTPNGATQTNYWNSALDIQWHNTTTFGKMTLTHIHEIDATRVIFRVQDIDSLIVNVTLIKDTVSEKDEAKINIPSFSVYPNPATTEITIISKDKLIDPCIYNINGQKVYCLTKTAQHQYKYIIDVSHLPKGVYFIKTGTEAKRIIIN